MSSALLHSTPLLALDAVVLDTETTGLDARTARLVQVGGVRIAAGRIVPGSDFERVVNPGVMIPPSSTAIHGIDDSMARAAPPFAALLPELQGFIGSAILIGHTISYDLTILHREAEMAGAALHLPKALDVRLLARVAAPTLAHYDLDRLCGWLGVENAARHTALADARATAEVSLALVARLRDRGVRTVAEADAASRRAAEREGQDLSLPIAASPTPADAAYVLQVIDSFPFRHRVRDVMSTPPIVVPGSTSIHAALRLLIDRKVSSVFVTDDDGRNGIVTERDLLRAMADAAPGVLELPISPLSNSPLITVRDDDFVYRAIGRIERHRIRHLGVVDRHGRLAGAVTTRNLLRHRATTAIVLGDEIDRAGGAAELAAAWAKLVPMARSLLAEDVDARLVAAVISAEVCAVTARCAVLAETRMAAQGHGAPPAPYCVLVLGSAGRGESLLAADQDNAIVYAHGQKDSAEDRWFAELAAHMNATLDEVGVPLCKGGVMARNAEWRMSAADWHAKIDTWIGRQRPTDLLNADIFFDAVPVHGNQALGESVIDLAWQRGAKTPDFIMLISELARAWHPPLTVFGRIRTEEDGRVDLKKGGLLPIFTGARALALRHGLRARSTPERLRSLADLGVGSSADIEGVIEAHRILLRMMLGQQLIDAERGVPLSSKVELRRLDAVARIELKQAMQRISSIVDMVSEGRL